ncbi:MAG: efflux RND transporter periplasmic adaptor subunit [Burkholderiaceae bacterium]
MTARRSVFYAAIAAGLAATLVFSFIWQRGPRPASEIQPAKAVGPGGAAAAGALPVEVSQVATRSLKDDLSAVGTLRSNESVMLKPEIAGRVSRIAFAEGQRVVRGAVLVELDAQVARAEAAQAKAQLELARSHFQRTQELSAKSFVSPSAKDQAASNLEVAQAAYALAQARLDRYTIRAPFDGVLGLRNVSVGDYVKDGADLVQVEDASSMKLDFRLPERFSAQIRAGQPVEFTLDALPGKPFKAQVQAIDSQVEANGRSLLVRARADNPGHQLKSGMFARVRVVLGERADAIVVPEEALVPGATGQVVFRVIDGKAVRTPVTPGQRREGVVEIIKGLTPGETIVTAGQIRLQRDGLPVRVVDGAAAKPASAETPAASAADKKPGV